MTLKQLNKVYAVTLKKARDLLEQVTWGAVTELTSVDMAEDAYQHRPLSTPQQKPKTVEEGLPAIASRHQGLENALLRKIQNDSELAGSWFKDSECSDLNPKTCKTWLDQTAELVSCLSILLHLSAGQPSRASELMQLRYCSSSEQGLSNLQLYEGSMVFQFTYSKLLNVAQGKSPKPFKFLPVAVSELFLGYLLMVRPWEKAAARVMVHGHLKKETAHDSSYVFVRKGLQMTPKHLGEVLRHIFSQQRILGMTVLTYRHLTVAICDQWMQPSANSKAASSSSLSVPTSSSASSSSSSSSGGLT